MKLLINLSEDAELRNYIKHLINEQVKSITREEIKGMVMPELNKLSEYKIEGLAERWLPQILHNFVHNHFSRIDPEVTKKIFEDSMDKIVNKIDINKLVKDYIKVKLNIV